MQATPWSLLEWLSIITTLLCDIAGSIHRNGGYSFLFPGISVISKSCTHNNRNHGISTHFLHTQELNGALNVENLPEALITIRNDQRDCAVDEDFILNAARIYRKELSLNDFMLDIHLQDAHRMRIMNKETLGNDSVTDIISISDELKHTKSDYYKNRTPFKDPTHYHLGEMFICPSYVKNQMEVDVSGEASSPTQGGVAVRMAGLSDLNTRICFLLAHGLLHLLGYDHQVDEDLLEMVEREDALLNAFLATKMAGS